MRSAYALTQALLLMAFEVVVMIKIGVTGVSVLVVWKWYDGGGDDDCGGGGGGGGGGW